MQRAKEMTTTGDAPQVTMWSGLTVLLVVKRGGKEASQVSNLLALFTLGGAFCVLYPGVLYQESPLVLLFTCIKSSTESLC